MFEDRDYKAAQYFKELVLQYLPFKCWVAGGSLRDYFLNQHIGDIDLFFPNEAEFRRARSFFTGSYVVLENENCVKIIEQVGNNTFSIDLVKKFYNNPYHLINSFDFTVCCCAVDLLGIYYNTRYFTDLEKRKLVICALPYPLSTLRRLQKYTKKGFNICNAELLKLAEGLRTVNFKDAQQNMIGLYEDGSPRFLGVD